MSYAPKSLLDLDAYLRSKGVPTVGIVGDNAHTYGYHLGKDRLRSGDYSATLARDKAALTNAASAIDIGNHSGLRALTNFLALAGASGAARDVREIIGPGLDGRAYRWAAENGWNRQGPRASGDSHEWHCHVSFYRDSEYRDKTGLFRPYTEGDDVSAEEVWKKDGIVPAPRVDQYGKPLTAEQIQANPFYAAGNYVQLMVEEQRKARGEAIAHNAALLAALAKHGQMPDATLAEIKAAAAEGAQQALAEVQITWSAPDTPQT